MNKLRVLVACEYSGIVRDAFSKLGHNAMSCDLLETDKPGNHFKGDVSSLLDEQWDLIIAHPPCTYIANSGVSHLYVKNPNRKESKERNEERWEKLNEGALFFKNILESKCAYIAVENPIPHKYGVEIIGRKYDQIIQPWMFGHREQKATCLWLKGLPMLRETLNVKEEMMLLPKRERQRLHYLPPSADRWKIRSTTYQGVADAMATQWGDFLINQNHI